MNQNACAQQCGTACFTRGVFCGSSDSTACVLGGVPLRPNDSYRRVICPIPRAVAQTSFLLCCDALVLVLLSRRSERQSPRRERQPATRGVADGQRGATGAPGGLFLGQGPLRNFLVQRRRRYGEKIPRFRRTVAGVVAAAGDAAGACWEAESMRPSGCGGERYLHPTRRSVSTFCSILEACVG